MRPRKPCPLTGSRDTADALGCSEQTLKTWRKKGKLKPGIHWRRKDPTASNSPVLYDVDLIEKMLRDTQAYVATPVPAARA